MDLVAEAQSRRLEEQRATFHTPQNLPKLAPARPLEDREQLYSTILSHQVRHPPGGTTQASWSLGPCSLLGPSLRSPLASTTITAPSYPIPITGVLYALHTTLAPFKAHSLRSSPTPSLPPLLQCQRMEAQRSEPPLPPGGQELLELLLRVQGGGRMEEQRSRPPTHTC